MPTPAEELHTAATDMQNQFRSHMNNLEQQLARLHGVVRPLVIAGGGTPNGNLSSETLFDTVMTDIGNTIAGMHYVVLRALSPVPPAPLSPAQAVQHDEWQEALDAREEELTARERALTARETGLAARERAAAPAAAPAAAGPATASTIAAPRPPSPMPSPVAASELA